jgi:lysozyme
LNENQRAAVASFIYNLGRGAFRASTLRKRINAGEFDDIPYQLSRWNKAGGRILRGLVRRRAAEANLWLLQPEYSW